jgi:nucleotide-binding universal stress UspA family protein
MENARVDPGTVVVGVDGSQHAQCALTWAAEQAVLEGRPLTVVHAAGEGDLRTTAWAGVEAGPPELRDVLGSARKVVTAAVSLVETAQPGLDVRGVPLVGDARHALIDLSDTAHLVVVGSRGRGTLRSMLLGSVSVSVAKHARCPVVVTRPGGHGVVKDGVLVGADGTAESLPVIEFAFRQASLRGVPLTVMHTSFDVAVAVAVASIRDEPSQGGPGLGSADDPADLRRLLSESVAGMSSEFPDVHVSLELGYGLVDECLTRGPRPRDLIVVGRHPVRSVSKLLSGSIATAVLERSDSPVAVVPESEPPARPAGRKE